ncbi:MAG: diadenylate cyclase [Methanoregulaceae archaeon]|nr:diadenylate cyclase [Methanoregulaceae archaeon]
MHMYNLFRKARPERILITLLSVFLLVLAATAADSNLTNTTETIRIPTATQSPFIANVTSPTAISTPTVNSTPTENATPAPPASTTPPIRFRSPPPVLALNRTSIQDLVVAVDGSAVSGSPGTNITHVQWDWGDGTVQEYPGFPNIHTYAEPGRYTFSVTAVQSDGQEFVQNVTITISAPKTQSTPFPPVSSPIPGPIDTPAVTVLSPEIDGLNVTLNGYTAPVLRNTTISTLMVDWGDGTAANYSALPQQHRYAHNGTYTVMLTAIRSDGQAASKSIAFELTGGEESRPPPPPPGDGGQILPIIAILIISGVLVTGGILQQVISRRREQGAPYLPPAVARQAEIFHQARERGDMVLAGESAESCARLLRELAEKTPGRRSLYLEKAVFWETIGAGIARDTPTIEVIGPSAERTALPVLSGDAAARICEGTDVRSDVLISVVGIAAGIAHEGREGKPIGTSFVIGDTSRVLEYSRQFVLNPFYGHGEQERRITDPSQWEMIKEFAQLDGAFIITGDGIVEAAGRYITVDASGVDIPGGMGSRHASIAAITMVTRSIGVVVSQSGGRISIMKKGRIEKTI